MTLEITHKRNIFAAMIIAGLAMSGLTTQALAQETRFDTLANLPFTENRPTKETAETLRDELLFQRATQAYLWALPLINTLGMKTGSRKRSSAQATTSCRSGKSASTQRL